MYSHFCPIHDALAGFEECSFMIHLLAVHHFLEMLEEAGYLFWELVQNGRLFLLKEEDWFSG